METRKNLAGENLSNRFCSSTYVVVVVAFDVEVCPSIVQKLARRSCFQTDCITFAGQYDA